MGSFGDLIGFLGDLMGFYGALMVITMGFYGDFSWDLLVTTLR